MSETVEGKPYAVRYVGSPYNCSSEECRSKLVYAHGRGKTEPLKLSPLNVEAVLEKFEITVEAYNEAFETQAKVININTPSSKNAG